MANSKIKVLEYIKMVFLIFFNPIWYLQKLISRDNNLWIFGAWLGNKYTDNAKVFYEYVKKNEPSIRAVWVTRNRNVFEKLKVEGHEVYLINSIESVTISLKAGLVLMSSGKPDVNSFFINGAKTVQLWHGGQLKKVGLDDRLVHNTIIDNFKKIALPYIFDYNTDHIISTAEIFNPILATAFNVKEINILKSGYPRNDVFFDSNYIHPFVSKIRKEFGNPNIILYLPTFRSSKNLSDLFHDYGFDEIRMNNLLQETNSVFILKGHYVDKNFGTKNAYKRIINLTDNEVPEINPILKNADILLTDYSSAYYDFLLTKKPIVFTAFDLTEYISQSRELYFDYSELVAGPITKNWIETEEQIRAILKTDKYMEKRIEKNKVYNQYNNGQSSEKLFEELKLVTGIS